MGDTQTLGDLDKTSRNPHSLDPRSSRNDEAASREQRRLHPVERCIRHPPTSGTVTSSIVKLVIHNPLRIGDDQNAQLAVVDVVKADPALTGLAEGNRVVAKIYDPLYSDDDEGYLNPFHIVEKSYVNETGAYTRLSELRGTWIPRYHGSFSLDIPVEGTSSTRIVRLILMEYIKGTTMLDSDPQTMSREERQRIMKHLIDFDTILYARDILYMNMHPRNVILAGHPSILGQHRPIVVVDFGHTRFRRSGFYPPRPEHEASLFPGTYISPLLGWHERRRRAVLRSFEDWIDWDWQPWLEAEYASTASPITDEMRATFLPSHLFETS